MGDECIGQMGDIHIPQMDDLLRVWTRTLPAALRRLEGLTALTSRRRRGGCGAVHFGGKNGGDCRLSSVGSKSGDLRHRGDDA